MSLFTQVKYEDASTCISGLAQEIPFSKKFTRQEQGARKLAIWYRPLRAQPFKSSTLVLANEHLSNSLCFECQQKSPPLPGGFIYDGASDRA